MESPVKVLDLGLAHPSYALALEERLATRENPPLEPVVVKWRSPARCYVHGRGRPPTAELAQVPREACVVERFTGGGTVYLDEGVLCIGVTLPTRGPARKDVGVLYEVLLQAILDELNRRQCCFERRNTNDVVFRGWKVMGTAGAIRSRAYHLHFTVLLHADLGWGLRWYRPLEELMRLHRGWSIDPVKHRPRNLYELEPHVGWSGLVMESVVEAVSRLGELL